MFNKLIDKVKNFNSVNFIASTALIISSHSIYGLEVYRTGNPENLNTVTNQKICLAGGANDDRWASGWKELLDASQGGDVLIIRADEKRGGYEDWIYNDSSGNQFPRVNSVTTVRLTDPSDTNRIELYEAIMNSELIFFAGGDQWLYMDWFSHSKALQALNYMFNVKKIPYAGTSAGMAFLSGISYSSRFQSPTDHITGFVTSADVVSNPLATYVDLINGLLVAPYLDHVISETHFSERGRRGRIIGFMAKAAHDHFRGLNYNTIKGIAADEGTAFCYDLSGQGKVHGIGNIFFLKGNSPIERIKPNNSLIWRGNYQAIDTYIIDAHQGTFNLKTWTGNDGRSEYWWVDGSNPSLNTY